MKIQTHFLAFWRELAALGAAVPLGLAARAWHVTRSPAEAHLLLAPSRAVRR